MDRAILLLTLMCAGVIAASARAADWPMWRHDAGRSSSTEEALPHTLHLQWTRTLSAPRQAWRDQSNSALYFDASYEPIVMHGLLFVCSMNSDSITAYDTATGRQKWRFYADGPMRFAPVADGGNVYAASDDGCVYCLDADDGKLLWRFRAVPREDRILGNQRLISTWPVRGGPVIYDNVLYVAASIWAFEGTFIYALDPATGRIIWCNSGSGTEWIKQQHGPGSFAGVCPQGYLAANQNALIVPSGRSVPGVYDRATGAMRYYHAASGTLGKDAGGYAVAIAGDRFLSDYPGKRYLYQLSDGAGVARAVPRGPIDNAVIYSTDEQLRLTSCVDNKTVKETPLARPVGAAHVKAGGTLFCAEEDGTVAGVQVADGTITWHTKIDGPVATMLVANGKLFVVSKQGVIHCFGPAETDPTTYAAATREGSVTPAPMSPALRSIFGDGMDTRGYAVVLGLTAHAIIDDLLAQTRMHVVVVDDHAGRIREFRAAMDARGLYGRRVAAIQADGLDAHLPPYLANVVIRQTPVTDAGALSTIYHSLRPYGGVAVLSNTLSEIQALAAQVDLPNCAISQRGAYVALTRVGALPGSADWTHQYADAGNSVTSQDGRIRPPFGLLWFGGETNDDILPRHGHGPSPQVVAGRLIIEGENILRCVDVYTGRRLWQRDIAKIGYYYRHTGHHPGAGEIGSNYTSLSDGIYLTTPRSCIVLDPVTGKTIHEFRLPDKNKTEAPKWGFTTVAGDYLVAATSPMNIEIPRPAPPPSGDSAADDTSPGQQASAAPQTNAPVRTFSQLPGVTINDDYAASSRCLYVLNRHTGDVLWHRDAVYAFRHNAIAIANDTLFCIDRLTDAKLAYARRRGLKLDTTPILYAMDIKTGAIKWKTDRDVFGTWLSYSKQHNLLVQAGSANRDRAADDVGKGIVVYRADTGDVVWQDLTLAYGGPLMLRGDEFITNGQHGQGYSLLTGKETGWTWDRQYGCNTAIASEHMLTFRSGAAGYFDLTGKSGTFSLGGFKSGCTANLIPANGVLSAPDYTRTCTCSYQNQSSLAFVHDPDIDAYSYNCRPRDGRLGINFGSDGDRLARNGTPWAEFPACGSPEQLAVHAEIDGGRFFQHHSLLYRTHALAWVGASGVVGMQSIRIEVEQGVYTVRLVFAESDADATPGQRIFDVSMAGEKILNDFDIARAASGARATVVREYRGVPLADVLTIAFTPEQGEPLICGIEVIRESSGDGSNGVATPPRN